eukprot:2555115-Amphidinium_carterae.1
MAIRPRLSAAAALQAEFPWHDKIWHGPALMHPSWADLEYISNDDPFKSMHGAARAACFERLCRLFAKERSNADRKLGFDGQQKEGSKDSGSRLAGKQVSNTSEALTMGVIVVRSS